MAKRDSWKSYVTRLNKDTKIKKVWETINKIRKGNVEQTIFPLKTDNRLLETKTDIVNALAKSFHAISSHASISPEVLRFQTREENKGLDFNSDNSEEYNRPFSLRELNEALSKAGDTAVGPDDIHYQMLKHLPLQSLQLLLNIFNNIWSSNTFPDEWQKAFIIAIPKPGKDQSNPKNYRPIALTSCLCKTLERMANGRLMWFLEDTNAISEHQCGFRKNKSTLDHLVKLETKIREAFIRKDHFVSIFFDLQKAYDTTWRFGILKDLQRVGIKGNLSCFIQNFLDNRSFRVRSGTTISQSVSQECGVPQGSILSVTLFMLKINSITQCLEDGVGCSLFVDDFAMYYSGKNMAHIERKLQHCLNKVQTWATENGFSFSKEKTVCVHFCQKRSLHLDPEVHLNNVQIPVVEQTKFLGLIFDKNLSFIPHITYLRKKCEKALNILKVVSKMDWGADSSTLLKLYRSLIRSKLDYGCAVYGSARQSYLKTLNTIQNQALRICLRAFRTSPINSLEVVASEPPLYIRREKLSLMYAQKLLSLPDNPNYDDLLHPAHEELFASRKNPILPFSLRVKPALATLCPNQDKILHFTFPAIPPWEIRTPLVNFDLAITSKEDTSDLIYKTKFAELRYKYRKYDAIYTDGSKDGISVAAAAVTDDNVLQIRLEDKSSIFTAEMIALRLALRHVKESDGTKFIIFSDSKSALQALANMHVYNPLVCRVLINLNDIFNAGKTIVFCWIPSHIGIQGNEEADRYAKAALDAEMSHFKVPFSDFKQSITQHSLDKWQETWDSETTNKLHEIEPIIQNIRPLRGRNRREDIVLCRIRIGHTHLTHSYLLRKEAAPLCPSCNRIISVKHIFLECQAYYPERMRLLNNPSTMREVFDIAPETIVTFLKEIGLFPKI